MSSSSMSSSSANQEPCDANTEDEMSLALTVPVFVSTQSGRRFENRLPSKEELKEDYKKNKILKPIQEEECEDHFVDRQAYKDTFKKVRKAIKSKDIGNGKKNPYFISSKKLYNKYY